MFITGLRKYPSFQSKNILNYCMDSTNWSIKKMINKYNLEKEKPIKFKLHNNKDYNKDYNKDDDINPIFNIYSFLIFLSVSSLGVYFYKKLK
jgi:hypothetical protein